jgi:hypothetical protein
MPQSLSSEVFFFVNKYVFKIFAALPIHSTSFFFHFIYLFFFIFLLLFICAYKAQINLKVRKKNTGIMFSSFCQFKTKLYLT